MSNQHNQNKIDFINLLLNNADHDSRDKEASREFLASEGVNTEKLVSEGLKRIKKKQLFFNAKNTEQEMEALESVKSAAIAWVDNILDNVNFSLAELVQKEELSMSFRNVESLSKEDIRNILIRYFTLKFMNEKNSR
jgi:hypothetical protein